jgi:fused signal recognition particle receptor
MQRWFRKAQRIRSKEEAMGLFSRKNKDKIDEGLSKTKTGFWGNIVNTLRGSEIDDELYEELEEQLVLADTGADVAEELVEALRTRVKAEHLKTGAEALKALKAIVSEELAPQAEMQLSGHPAVILVIGVNGVGKTTSIAKLAAYYKAEGKSVLLAAGDTFRAAAGEQLDIWATRAGVPIVKSVEGADPAAVIFDAVHSAAAKGVDLVICDTAGRLHNKKNLMDELSKISRSVTKAAPEASVETLLVLDAITGQNAIRQAQEFVAAAGATGVILTKLDGTAKGGCVVSVKRKLGLPVRFVGVGEKIDDLIPFSAADFADSLLNEAGQSAD